MKTNWETKNPIVLILDSLRELKQHFLRKKKKIANDVDAAEINALNANEIEREETYQKMRQLCINKAETFARDKSFECEKAAENSKYHFEFKRAKEIDPNSDC